MLYCQISLKKKSAVQELEREAPSEEKLNRHLAIAMELHVLCADASPPSPSTLPSCWRTASVSAQTLTTHALWGLREDTL